jgi:hypothetical protein
MSIYGTLFEIGLRRFGEEGYIEILVQSVPPHVDYTGDEWAFLPKPVDPAGNTPRAVFFVESGDEKGTPRNGQEYVQPLLVLTGKEYEEIRYTDLMCHLEAALERRYGPEPVLIASQPDGTVTKVHRDGKTTNGPK